MSCMQRRTARLDIQFEGNRTRRRSWTTLKNVVTSAKRERVLLTLLCVAEDAKFWSVSGPPAARLGPKNAWGFLATLLPRQGGTLSFYGPFERKQKKLNNLQYSIASLKQYVFLESGN